MYEDLKNKTAVITGVGSERGMGFAIASRLAVESCNVFLVDVCPVEIITAIAENIQKHGGKATPYWCDITDEAAVSEMVNAAIDTYGSIDILINNAGVLRAKAYMDYTPGDWDFMFNVMVKGSFLCSKAVAAHMLEKNIKGTIINMASMGGKHVFSGEAAYGTCKRAVVHLTQAAATELSPHGIRVNGIAPGDHWTDMLEKCFKEMAKQEGCTVEDLIAESEAETPLRRLGTTEDVANLCAFLVSQQASFITGQVINVNGGLYME